MFVIYLKSADEKTVVKVSNPKSQPTISPWYSDHGYTEIDYEEFKKIRARLKRKQRVTSGFTHDEQELQKHLLHLQGQHKKFPEPIQTWK